MRLLWANSLELGANTRVNVRPSSMLDLGDRAPLAAPRARGLRGPQETLLPPLPAPHNHSHTWPAEQPGHPPSPKPLSLSFLI